MTAAAAELNVGVSALSACVNGITAQAGGWKWRFASKHTATALKMGVSDVCIQYSTLLCMYALARPGLIWVSDRINTGIFQTCRTRVEIRDTTTVGCRIYHTLAPSFKLDFALERDFLLHLSRHCIRSPIIAQGEIFFYGRGAGPVLGGPSTGFSNCLLLTYARHLISL